MRTIWKYELGVANTPVNFNIPKNAEACFVGLSPDTGKVSVWMDIPDTEAKPERRTFLIHGTGHAASPYEKYAGSVIENQFVWHVFEALI